MGADAGMVQARSFESAARYGPLEEDGQGFAAGDRPVPGMQPRGKRLLLTGRELQQHIAGANEFTRRFQRWLEANVGIVTGRVSGIVANIDAHHGGPDSIAGVATLPVHLCGAGGASGSGRARIQGLSGRNPRQTSWHDSVGILTRLCVG